MIIFMKYNYLLITLIIAITSNNALAQKKCPKYGDWNNGCYGTYTFEDQEDEYWEGAVYEGQWDNDKEHGHGKMTIKNGETFIGEFKNGSIVYGKYTYSGGHVYQGKFEDFSMNGQGTVLSPNGQTYTGEFKNGWGHKEGVYTWPSGEKYSGEIKSGTFDAHGYGVYTWPSGQKYTGNFKDGELHGSGKMSYSDGYIEEGNWIDGVYSVYSQSIDENKAENNKKNSYIDNSKVFPAASGTAFSISENGYLITNDHVINDCARLTAHNDNLESEAKVILNDPLNDVALLKTDLSRLTAVPFSISKAALMQEIYVAGFPFGDYYSSSVKVTKGIVSALSGMGNNFSNFQIDAALQPGNSGGPVIDEKGNLIGVAVAKLDQSATFDDFGTLPENTNFAIKTGVIKNILDAAKIEPRQANKKNLSRDKLATLIVDSTFHITCFMTESQIKKIQSQAKKDKVLFKNIKF